MSSTPSSRAGTAIIGMSGRFRGAGNIDDFWQMVCSAPPELELRLPDPVEVAGSAVPHGAAGSGYRPDTAHSLDAQQHLFLTYVWEALERAGYDPATYHGSIGVYSSTALNRYPLLNLFSCYSLRMQRRDASVDAAKAYPPGDEPDCFVNGTSYKLDLRWPDFSIRNTCASSLIAVHLACQDLQTGVCDMAIVGGVTPNGRQAHNADLPQHHPPGGNGSAAAPGVDAGDPLTGGEVGILVLRRVADAWIDGDQIYAVIRGSVINQAAPTTGSSQSIADQAELIRSALAVTEIAAETIGYVEACDPGIAAGGSIEIAAFSQMLRASSAKPQCCHIGAPSASAGDQDTTGDVAGLFKVVLALHHQCLPPGLCLDLMEVPFDPAVSSVAGTGLPVTWSETENPRRASLSSLGRDGTSVHFILEESPLARIPEPSRSEQILVLSADTRAALETDTLQLIAHLKQHTGQNLADISYTLQTGRRTANYRRLLVCRDRDDAILALEHRNLRRVLTQYQQPVERSIVFMFSGYGSQYLNMGRELYQTEMVFRKHVDYCTEVLQPYLECDLREVLYPDIAGDPLAARRLQQPWLAQPALFVIESALARLWMAWGIYPDAMIGYGLSEYVAAYLAGVFTLEDTLALVALFGQQLEQIPIGAMLSIPLPIHAVAPFLSGQLTVAAINTPTSCAVSGPPEELHLLEQRLLARGCICQQLSDTQALHAALRDPMMQFVRAEVEKINRHTPDIPYISSITGTWITPEETQSPDYWVHQLRQPVLFADGIQRLLQEPRRILLEVGPGRTLSTLAQYHPARTREHLILSSLRQNLDSESDITFLLTKLGRLWLAGVPVNWAGFYVDEQRQRLPLPIRTGTPSMTESEPDVQTATLFSRSSELPPRKTPPDWFYLPVWKQTVPPASKPVLNGSSSWLLFVDEQIGPLIAQRLEQMQQQVTLVQIGPRFQQIGPRHYTINPGTPHDYQALIHAIGACPTNIIHMWGMTPADTMVSTTEQLNQSQMYGFCSLLLLVQALEPYLTAASLQVSVVSTHMQRLIGDTMLFPEKATVLGLCKTLPQIYPTMTVQSIDLQLPLTGNRQATRLIDQLLGEFAAHAPDPVIAYREGQRWTQVYEPVHLDVGDSSTIRLTENGVYLIIGSLTGVSSTLVEYLTLTARARVALLVPFMLPERAACSHSVAMHDEEAHDGVGQILRNILALEAVGIQVMVIGTDTTSQDNLAQALQRVQTVLGPIDGVFVFDDDEGNPAINPLTAAEVDTYVRQIQTRLQRLRTLADLLPEVAPAFCLVQSSMGAITGDKRDIVGAAVGTFAAVLTQWQTYHNPGTWINVNWEHWSRTPDEPTTLTLEEGIVALTQILAWGVSAQVVVSPNDIAIRPGARPQRPEAPVAELPARTAPLLNIRPLPSSYVAPRDDLEWILAEIWCSVLGIDRISIHDDFADVGGNSVICIEVAARMRERGLRVNPRDLRDNATIAQLAVVLQRPAQEEPLLNQAVYQ